MAPEIDVRPVTEAELPALVEVFGQNYFFAERFDRQREGLGILLAAWTGGDLPAGNIYVWLSPAEEQELRHRLPDVPLLTHLEVREGLRNRGIGTRLMRAAEDGLADIGFRRVVLGVDPANEGAIRLYLRLGYVEWPHGRLATEKVTFLPDRRETREREECLVLTKELTRPSGSGA